MDKTIIQARKPMRMIRMANDSRVENLSFRGAWDGADDSYNQGDRHGFGVVINNVRNVALINVGVRNQSAQGISSSHARALCLWNIKLARNGHRGINLSNFTHQVVMHNIEGQDARLAHVLVGHGSHHVRMANLDLKDMMLTRHDERAGLHNNNAFVWLSQGVHHVRINGVRLRQTRLHPQMRPKGLLIANSRNNSLRSVSMENLPIGVHLVAARVDVIYEGLPNEDTTANTFEDIKIVANHATPTIAAVHLTSTQKFFAPGRCGLRRLDDADRDLLPRVRGNNFSGLKIEGYNVRFLEAPTQFWSESVPPAAFVVDGRRPRDVVRRPIKEDVRGAARW
ncbi:MAG: hypothetical protein R3D67_07585 [Hyphomicrobiaceae bacterium]